VQPGHSGVPCNTVDHGENDNYADPVSGKGPHLRLPSVFFHPKNWIIAAVKLRQYRPEFLLSRLPKSAHNPHVTGRLDRTITAIILCGDDAVGIINSEMSAEHHRQLTQIRKLARSVATQAPLMRQHFEIMYHISDGLDPHQIAAKLEISVEMVRNHIDIIVSRLTNARTKIQASYDISTSRTSNSTRHTASR
jgi:DNA-binding CsgD family transcriptional regulator